MRRSLRLRCTRPADWLDSVQRRSMMSPPPSSRITEAGAWVKPATCRGSIDRHSHRANTEHWGGDLRTRRLKARTGWSIAVSALALAAACGQRTAPGREDGGASTEARCAAPLTKWYGKYVNLSSDSENCGACGTRCCASSFGCYLGRCDHVEGHPRGSPDGECIRFRARFCWVQGSGGAHEPDG
jgi:hypothetical protein